MYADADWTYQREQRRLREWWKSHSRDRHGRLSRPKQAEPGEEQLTSGSYHLLRCIYYTHDYKGSGAINIHPDMTVINAVITLDITLATVISAQRKPLIRSILEALMVSFTLPHISSSLCVFQALHLLSKTQLQWGKMILSWDFLALNWNDWTDQSLHFWLQLLSLRGGTWAAPSGGTLSLFMAFWRSPPSSSVVTRVWTQFKYELSVFPLRTQTVVFYRCPCVCVSTSVSEMSCVIFLQV